MEEQFETHISAEHRLFDLHIRETFRYRDLIILFVKKNFTTQYKQTILGPAWAIIQPLLTTIVFTIVFGSLAKLTTADTDGDFVIPAFLFYMAGNICWGYFSNTLKIISNTVLYNRRVMEKVYYPRVVSPISTALDRLISFGIQFALFLGFWLFYILRGGTDIRVTGRLLLIPLIIFQMMILAAGTGMVISSLTTKYRDLAMLVDFGLELWRYGCPIAYGLSLVPDRYLGLYLLNPAVSILTSFRYAVFGFGFFDLKYCLLSWLVSIAILMLGLVLFSRIERTFMDTI